MAQILDALPSHHEQRLLCSYVNSSPLVQIACITNVPGWYFEQVVFPCDRILFETVPEAILQIHSTTTFGALKVNYVACPGLRVVEKKRYVSPSL